MQMPSFRMPSLVCPSGPPGRGMCFEGGDCRFPAADESLNQPNGFLCHRDIVIETTH